MHTPAMSAKDALLAAAVVLAWGVNFLFMRQALLEVQPMTLGLLRFALMLLPALFFFPRPALPWRWLAAYGLAISFGQFSLMFIAIAQGMPTGLAALLHQAQAFFTVLMAALLWRERTLPHHLLGLCMAAAALALIGVGQYRGALPLAGVGIVLASAACWAAGNLMVKRFGQVNALSLVLWGNVSSLLAFALAALALHGLQGPEGVWTQVSGMSWRGWLSVLYLAGVAGLLGYAGWGALLARHPAGKIAPLALLVPVIALLVGWAFLHERLNAWHWAGVALMMAALLVHVLGGRLKGR